MYDYVNIGSLRLDRIRKFTGMGSPAPRRDVTLKASRHGAIDRTQFYDGRVLSIEALIVEDTPLAAWDKLDTLEGEFQLGTAHTLSFRRSGRPDDEQCEVIVASPLDASVSYEESNTIRWGVELFAADPRVYGAALRSGSYDPAAATSGGGIDLPMTFPLTFPTDSTAELQLDNAGNFPTPPLLTIDGPVINPVIDNDTSGESISVVYSLGADDSVQVDVANRSVSLNGSKRLDLLNAENTVWWNMEPGTNRIRLRGSGMATGVTLLTVQYRDARI